MKKYKRVYIEITNICNLNCSFCPITERQMMYMTLDKFENTLKKVAPIAEQICLHLMGEPLAHPQFKNILEICFKYDSKIQLTTNGLLLKKYFNDILNSQSVRQVNISVQSYLDNFPTRDINKYLDEIYHFISAAMKKNEDLYMNIRLWNIVDEKSKDLNEKIFKYFEAKLNITINRNIELGNIKSKRLIGRLYLHFDSRFEWPRTEMAFQSINGRCNGLIDHFAIHADGSVVPCCLDDQKILFLGNIFESPLDSIINSDRAKKMVDGFQNKILIEDLCQKCTYINRFKK